MNIPIPAQQYVRHVLDLFRLTPDTSGRPRPADRRLAAQLHNRGIPLDTIYAALLLATARRTLRPENAPPLTPIRSLHYFLPVVEELLRSPLEPDYLQFLQHKLSGKIDRLPVLALGQHQLP